MTSLLERVRGRLPWLSGNTSDKLANTEENTTETELAERTQLALAENENTLLLGSRRFGDTEHDRQPYERQELMENCLEAWRFNPLARRIIELTTQYVIGGGMTLSADDASSEAFLQSFWRHPLNKMDLKLPELSDELARTGNLFLMLSGDLSGMSFARVVPSTDVLSIHSRANDVEQELSYTLRGVGGEEDYVVPAWRADRPATQQNTVCILHYAVNRPAGAQWGEPDLAPVLRWLARYSAWLEDRVRLNHFRNAFVYVVKARFANENARRLRQMQLTAQPPNAGSILVCDENEDWSVLSPKLEALDASTDGLAIKKMIAAGVGIPLHFLAEPESSTKTTAESAGHPTYRRFEERQRVLCWILEDLLGVVLKRKAVFDNGINPNAKIIVRGGDVQSRDNLELARAGQGMTGMALRMVDKGMIDAPEALRLIYRFIAEKAPETNP
jgi:hypothetical protein